MAASSAAFVAVCARLLGVDLPGAVYWLAFVGTWFVYVVDAGRGNSQEDWRNQPLRAEFFARNRVAVGAALMAAILTVPWAIGRLRLDPAADLLLLVLGLVGVGYVVALLPWGGERRTLKQIGAAKSIVITIAWAIGGLGVPLALGHANGAGRAAPLFGMAAFFTLLLFLDTLALDDRDRRGDVRSGVATAATVLGRWTRPVLEAGTALAGLLWLVQVRGGDARWLAMGATWLAWAVAVLLHHRLKEREIPCGVAISAWRFVALVVLLMV
ncbi:hypothetical protein KQI84_09260 [bacterium]|nr:hypothetical protein [bacterium]